MTKEYNDLANAYVMALAHYQEINKLFSSISREYSFSDSTKGQLRNILKMNELLARTCQKEVIENLKDKPIKLKQN